MKMKVNYPFLYFLAEPNIIMVYRIATQNYVIGLDVVQPDVWEAYELSDSDMFDTFTHEQHQRVEGKSFFIEQHELTKIVEEINTQIQNERRRLDLSNPLPEQQSPVHLVMSQSAAGSLRVALPRPTTVIGIPDCFSIGPLWKLHDKIGLDFRAEWLVEHINDEQEEDVFYQQFSNTVRQIEDLSNHVPIYIWYADNADEQTGMRFILYLLREKTNKIYLINLTAQYCTEEEHPIFHTSQMDSAIVRMLFEKKGEPLSHIKRMHLQKEWQQLSETKDVLRVWLDNKIKGMPEHYYDSFIIETIEKIHKKQENTEFIKAGLVIVEILEQMNESINIFFIEYRIRHLIYSGQLELKGIPKSMRHYSVRLR